MRERGKLCCKEHEAILSQCICLADDAGLWSGEKRFAERAICDDSSRIASVPLYHAGFMKGKAGEVWDDDDEVGEGVAELSPKSNFETGPPRLLLRCLRASVTFTREAASSPTKDSEGVIATSCEFLSGMGMR